MAAKREAVEERKKRARRIVRGLMRLHPDAECALHHADALQLLMATILSAQCTDERVNQVTPALFRRYRTAKHYAEADPAELEEAIRTTGFFRNKARSIVRGSWRSSATDWPTSSRSSPRRSARETRSPTTSKPTHSR